jgi:signal transduction histidine kinase
MAEAEVATAAAAPSHAELGRAYRETMADLFLSRVRGVLTFFILVSLVTLPAEAVLRPERMLTAMILLCGCTLTSAFGLVALGRITWRRYAKTFFTLVVTVLVEIMTYDAVVWGTAADVAMVLACFSTAVAVLLPWDWRCQLATSGAFFVMFAVVQPFLGMTAPEPGVVMFVGLTSAFTVVGVGHVDRYRRQAFVRRALLQHASAEKEEEARIATALFQLARTLDEYLGEDDLVRRVGGIAANVLGCGESRIVLAKGENDRAKPPLPDLKPGFLLEVPAGRPGDGATLYVPLCRQQVLLGGLAFTAHPAGAFTRTQYRLAFGIAHTAAVALENHRLIAALRTANRVKSDFLSTMSHELRTPLHIIDGCADMLASGAYGSQLPEALETIARIQRNVRHQLDLIDATVDLNQLEAGRDVIEYKSVDLDALFADIRRTAGAVGNGVVALRWCNRLAGAALRSDPAKLRTILTHLVQNALTFTPAGEVEVTASEADGQLVLTVRDTGIGIAPADVPLIFEMFRQLGPSETRDFGGTGLGLYIVKRVVERLGGTIRVDSTPGAGSTFTIRIPLVPATSPNPRPGETVRT